MNSTEFCFWLQGFLELREDDKPLTAKQVQIVKDHLALVFQKVTPDRSAEAEEPDVWPGDPQPPVTISPLDLPGVTCDGPAQNPEQTRINIEEMVKKIHSTPRTQWDSRTYCFTDPLSIKLC